MQDETKASIVRRIFTKQQVMTLPNLMSLFRLLLIPLIIWQYIGKANFKTAALLIVLSGATDVADGFVARRFNMVSDLGKILDPMADKLTQIAIVICLTVHYSLMKILAAVFIAKELAMIVLGLVTMKRTDTVNSSKWYGKATTVFMYFTMMVLILIPSISLGAANVLIGICIAMVLFSLMMYMSFYRSFLKKEE